MTPARYAVGEPWPHALAANGLQATLTEALDLALLAGIWRPTGKEIEAMRIGQLRIGVLPSLPLVWIMLDAGAVSFDAPYALGLEPAEKRASIIEHAAAIGTWPESNRGLISIFTVDSVSRRIGAIRTVTLSRTWWLALADGLRASGAPLSGAAQSAAIKRDYKRWPITAEMFAAASVVEIGGAI